MAKEEKSLSEVFKDFNAAIVNLVCKHLNENNYENYHLWFYNTDDDRVIEVKKCGNDIKEEKEDEKSILETYGAKFLFYIWIEYKDKKIEFFYKEVDRHTLNFHVYPGIVQEYTKIDEQEYSDINENLKNAEKVPLLKYTESDTDSGLSMENVISSSGGVPFAEKICSYVWMPENIGKDAYDNSKKVEGIDGLSVALKDSLQKCKEIASEYLEQIDGVFVYTRGGYGQGKNKYLRWIDANFNGNPFAFNFLHVFYKEGVGMFVAYNKIKITPAKEKEGNNERNRVNYKCDDKVIITYDVKADKEWLTGLGSTPFPIDELDEKADFLKSNIDKALKNRTAFTDN